MSLALPDGDVRAPGQLLVITIVCAGLATGAANAADKRAGRPFGVRTTGGVLAYDGTARRRTGPVKALTVGSATTRGARARVPVAYTPHAGTTPGAEGDVVRDEHGNAAGNEYDLAYDGAFAGRRIAVLQLYNGEDEPAGTAPFDFAAPSAALEEKGFQVHRWTALPDAAELKRVLRRSSQLWVISGRQPSRLTEDHHAAIASFFDQGHGLYLWGDNEPFVVEANEIGERMFGARLQGDYGADQHLAPEGTQMANPGIKQHLVTTGLERLYEGVTTSAITQRRFSYAMKDLLVDSSGGIVAGVHESSGRAIMDGGFTRLFLKWDTAGTARYVKNAASWLANAERFDP